MPESTVLPIVRAVDWKVIFRVVTLSQPTRLSDDEKLEVLRRLDQFRQWRSLDDERYCLVCGKIIAGRQIRVAGGTRGNGSLRVSCPTQGCNSIPMDWVLTTNEILANVERLAAEERKASALKPAAVNGDSQAIHNDKSDERFVSRIRRFASHLMRQS